MTRNFNTMDEGETKDIDEKNETKSEEKDDEELKRLDLVSDYNSYTNINNHNHFSDKFTIGINSHGNNSHGNNSTHGNIPALTLPKSTTLTPTPTPTLTPTATARSTKKLSFDFNFSNCGLKLHILVVDDSRLNRKMLSKSLRSDGKNLCQ